MLVFMILFIFFIIAGPLNWWFRNLYRYLYGRENDIWNKSIKWVWIFGTLIGVAFGLMAILVN